MDIKLKIGVLAVTAALAGCGGGGGGGSGGGGSYVLPDVPFFAPVRVSSFTPINGSAGYNSSALYAQNLSGSGQEIITAGRADMGSSTAPQQTYNINIWGWQNGSLVNKTSQWFANASNSIIGTEPSVKFADFNGDGKTDMYVAPNTDREAYGPGAVFLNTGSTFVRSDLTLPDRMAAHDSAVYDLNRDGYADVINMGFGTVTLSFGSKNGIFTTYQDSRGQANGSGVAVGDFMGTGRATIIATDNNGANRLYDWRLQDNRLYMDEISVLPTPRFLLPKWASYNFGGAHDVRALAFDFDNSGRTSAVIFSRPWLTNGQWPQYSEVQFLKNMGSGQFKDVTDSTLIGYNTATAVTYNPALVDVNGDGLMDIVLSSPDYTSNGGSQVLIHTREHQYVASYATVIKAFQDQSFNLERAINKSAFYGANGFVFVQGPDGNMYMATAVSYHDSSGTLQKTLYLSKLGTTASTSASATAAIVKQTWPWMSAAQVNQVLANSSISWFGMNLLDPSKAMNPVGELRLPLSNKMVNLTGGVSGLQLNGAANQIKVMDSLGRDFTVNYSSTSMAGTNSWSQFQENIRDDTRSGQVTGLTGANYQGYKVAGSDDNRSMIIGLTEMDVGMGIRANFQFTRMPFNPFVRLSGSWGTVRSSATTETVLTRRQDGWVAKAGLMQTVTEMDPGLVTRINPIVSAWAELGHEWSRLKIYGGMLPKVLSGTADLSLPTAVDASGQVQYTNSKATLDSPTVYYARVAYEGQINKHLKYRLTGMTNTENQTSVYGDLRLSF